MLPIAQASFPETPEIIHTVFTFLRPADLIASSLVSLLWRTLAHSNILWKPYAHTTHGHSALDESIMRRVIEECKETCNVAKYIYDCAHNKNILLKKNAILRDCRVIKQKLVFQTMYTHISKFPTHRISRFFMKLFNCSLVKAECNVETDIGELHQTIGTQKYTAIQKLMHIYFLMLWTELCDKKCSEEELTTLVFLFKQMGLQVGTRFFLKFQRFFGQYELAMENLALCVDNGKEEASYNNILWITLIEHIAQASIDAALKSSLVTKDRFEMPNFWCILLRKLSCVSFNLCYEYAHVIVEKANGLNQQEIKKFSLILQCYMKSIYCDETISCSTTIQLDQLKGNTLFFSSGKETTSSQ